MRSYDKPILVLVGCVALWIFACVIWGVNGPGQEVNPVVELLKVQEGFRAEAYTDTRGNLTIGYGTDLSFGISRDEGEDLLRSRLDKSLTYLAFRWKPYWGWGGRWWPFTGMPSETRRSLLDMSYQLGVNGVLEFTEMLAALERGDCPSAKAAALDSAWHRETPERAVRVTALLCH